MNLRELVDAWRKIIQISSKPDRDEYMALLKITLLGFALIGLIAFAIRLIFYTLLFPFPG
ncbi:MAG: protein translocase SEC61 complex subunit gamma [Desulfurococcaceae archaeon]|nr:protein translocase SEC61 complex subunit gamma [Desulfurococcaceae archaeon]